MTAIQIAATDVPQYARLNSATLVQERQASALASAFSMRLIEICLKTQEATPTQTIAILTRVAIGGISHQH